MDVRVSYEDDSGFHLDYFRHNGEFVESYTWKIEQNETYKKLRKSGARAVVACNPLHFPAQCVAALVRKSHDCAHISSSGGNFHWKMPIEKASGSTLPFEDVKILRHFRACPESETQCLLYGPPKMLEAAKNPLRPAFGWSNKVEPGIDVRPGGELGKVINKAKGLGPEAGFSAQITQGPGDEMDKNARYPVWLLLGDKRIYAFDTVFRGPPLGGGVLHIERRGEVVVLSLISVEGLGLDMRAFHAKTGRAISPALHVTGGSYDSANVCNTTICMVFPLPVWNKGRFGVVYVGTEEGHIYFADPRGPAQEVEVINAEQVMELASIHSGKAPALFRLRSLAGLMKTVLEPIPLDASFDGLSPDVSCHFVVSDPEPPLNVRASHRPGAKVLGTIENGTKITVLDRKGRWIQINSPEKGWVWSGSLREECSR